MPLENGNLLNQRYRILDILGQGGMGAVYRAIDENLDTIVAVKENSFFSDEYARQFQREAKVLANLRHPNLPRVFDYFVIDQQGQYLVMDYIEGDDLRQWMSREESITEIEAIQIGLAICDALIYLHNQDPVITHRDIKPGNIKITPEGEVLLVDFGLVKILNEKELTTTAARAMTPGYSPPEQYGDAATDHRSDIFSLGATLYAALAGYLAEDSLARVTGKTELTPLLKYNKQISPKTAAVIEKALELRFEDRWQSASELKDALLETRRTIPRSEWDTNRIASYETGSQENQDRFNTSGKILPQIGSLFTRLRQWLDPVWLIFVIMIVLLLTMLGISLIWPEGFQGFIITPTAGNTTTTPPIFANPTLPAVSPNPTNATTGTPDPAGTDEVIAPAGGTPSPTPIGGGRGMIAFVSERTGKPQIWLFNLEDEDAAQLTDLPDGACQPDWAPTGDRIVFTSPCANKRTQYAGSSLYIIDVENGGVSSLPKSLEGDFDPTWSPDGQWIAYTTLINRQMQIVKINLEDMNIVRLSDGEYEDSDPVWSSDGEQLAFVRLRTVNQIWIMDEDGENQVQFTRSGLIDNSNPEWFAKENVILFSQVLGLGSPSKQLYGQRLEDIGQAEEYPLVPQSETDYIPLMDNVDASPDGFWLAFDYWYYDILSDIYIMTFPSANLIQLTGHPDQDYDPVWRPLP